MEVAQCLYLDFIIIIIIITQRTYITTNNVLFAIEIN